jgi:hypothetical protein
MGAGSPQAWHLKCRCQAFYFLGFTMCRGFSVFHPLYGEFNKAGAIKRLLRFHHFKPALNGFLYICKGFFVSFPLRKTARKCWDLSHKVSRLILFNNYVQFHKNLQFLLSGSLISDRTLGPSTDTFISYTATDSTFSTGRF